jgi:serine/threonine-protein kinase
MTDPHEIYGYTIVGTLGYGARSSIYAVRDSKGGLYALKRVIKNGPSDQRFIDQAVHEHEIACQFDDPRLRKSHRLIKHRKFITISEVLVVMELADGLSLEERAPQTVRRTCEICMEAAHGLQTMHQGGYVHADIKPNNILVNDEGTKIKIIDFGQSCKIKTVKERIQGTPDYIAPEQVKRQPITPATDVFNLGATIYWLLTNQHVPTKLPRGEHSVNIRTEERLKEPRELNKGVVPALNALVLDCIKHHPSQRPEHMQQVIDRLEVARAQLERGGAAGEENAQQRASSA